MLNPAASGVTVCIPTYRRAAQLGRLLRALQDQHSVEAFDIVIGNNDEQPLASSPELNDSSLPRFREVRVSTRGVSAVRNAIIGEAARDCAVRWIACLDDDQIPEPGWLAALVATGHDFDADLVGGPVIRTAPTATAWSLAATDASFLPTRAGPTAMLNEAGNLLIATRFLATLDRPPFSLEFGRTGGEDYEFFLFARGRGARIVWAPDALVREPLPVDRLTLRAFAWREYTIGAYQARADLRHHGRNAVLASILVAAAKIPVQSVRALRRPPRIAFLMGVVARSFAGLAGRVAGLSGLRVERYGRAIVPAGEAAGSNDRPTK